jgi:hypothetical protein
LGDHWHHLGENLASEEAELGDSYTHYGYMNVDCSNGGGMADGRLASAVVVFAAGEHTEGEAEYPLRVIGVITPQQPYTPGSEPPLIGRVELVPGKVIVSEAWYGPGDATFCASGRATTIWTYSHRKLISPRTVVDLAPQPSRP